MQDKANIYFLYHHDKKKISGKYYGTPHIQHRKKQIFTDLVARGEGDIALDVGGVEGQEEAFPAVLVADAALGFITSLKKESQML